MRGEGEEEGGGEVDAGAVEFFEARGGREGGRERRVSKRSTITLIESQANRGLTERGRKTTTKE